MDTYGTDNTLAIALSQDTSDKDALDSMERLVTALMSNPSTSSGEVLRNHLLLDNSFKLKIWKPLSKELYWKTVSDGTCGYQFLYQMYLRGLRKTSPDEFPVLLSPDKIEGFRSYLEGLSLIHI